MSLSHLSVTLHTFWPQVHENGISCFIKIDAFCQFFQLFNKILDFFFLQAWLYFFDCLPSSFWWFFLTIILMSIKAYISFDKMDDLMLRKTKFFDLKIISWNQDLWFFVDGPWCHLEDAWFLSLWLWFHLYVYLWFHQAVFVEVDGNIDLLGPFPFCQKHLQLHESLLKWLQSKIKSLKLEWFEIKSIIEPSEKSNSNKFQ